MSTSTNACTNLEHICGLDINKTPTFARKTGIICTIGPVSQSPENLVKLMEAGMTIARLNFSHGSHEYHAETISNVRKAVEIYSNKIGFKAAIAIALDTKGPEIRTGLIQGSGSAEIQLKAGDKYRLTIDKEMEEKGDQWMTYVDYKNIVNVLQINDRIYIDDGLLCLIAEEITKDCVYCVVENGGTLGSRKGVNLPGVPIDLPAVSEKDKRDLKFGVEQGVDIIFASFIRNASALKEIRSILGVEGNNIKVISKIENQQGINNIDSIIAEGDGIMIARGDLGIEIPPEKVFIAQKTILARCNRVGKPGLCATQMLESMTSKPRPTRAEISDVANAVLDGADCTMLSGETAKGKYPVQCVQIMSKTLVEAEAAIWHDCRFREFVRLQANPLDATHSLAIATVECAAKTEATGIIVLTKNGRTAHLISKYRPECPVICVTRHQQIARQCHLYRGLFPAIFEEPKPEEWIKDVDRRVMFGVDFGKKNNFIKTGDAIVVVTGWKEGSGFSNTMRIIYCV